MLIAATFALTRPDEIGQDAKRLAELVTFNRNCEPDQPGVDLLSGKYAGHDDDQRRFEEKFNEHMRTLADGFSCDDVSGR